MILFLFLFIIGYWYSLSKTPRNIIKYNWVITILIILIAGLRHEAIYHDTYGYVQVFTTLENMSVGDIIWRWPRDSFFYVASHYLHPILFHSYTLWLLLISVVYILPLSIIMKRYSEHPMYSWLCYIFVGLLMFVMAGLRQTVAMGLCLTAFLMLQDGKKKYFWLLLVFAYLFHSTALIFALAYPLSQMKLTTKSVVIALIAFGVIMLAGTSLLSSIGELISEEDDRYLGYVERLHGSNYTYFFQQLILTLPSLYILKGRWGEPLIAMFGNFSLVALLFVAMSPIIAEMFRISMYFSWSTMILFPMAMMELIKRKSSPLPSLYLLFFIVYLIFINKTATTEYYFYFQDASHIIKSFKW